MKPLLPQWQLLFALAEVGPALVCPLGPLYPPGLVAFASRESCHPLLKLGLHPRGARIGIETAAWPLPEGTKKFNRFCMA